MEGESGEWRSRRYEPTTKALGERFGIGINAVTGLLKEPESPKRRGRKGYLVSEWGAYFLKRRASSKEVVRARELQAENLKEIIRARRLANDEKERKMVPREAVLAWCSRYGKLVNDIMGGLRDRAVLEGLEPRLVKCAEDMGEEAKRLLCEGLAEWTT